MVDMEVAVARPQRWDAPFGPDMTDASADSLLAVEPFCSINPEAFPPTLPLRELLRNDVRVLHYAPGDVIVREGDYGSSAFLILAGWAGGKRCGRSPRGPGSRRSAISPPIGPPAPRRRDRPSTTRRAACFCRTCRACSTVARRRRSAGGKSSASWRR